VEFGGADAFSRSLSWARDVGGGRANGGRSWGWGGRRCSKLLLDDDFLAVVLVRRAGVGVVVRVVVLGTVDGVGYAFGDLVGCLVKTVAERVILAVFVVISHITLVLLGGVGSGTSSTFYSDLGWIA
jgi:hypothetical protein